jgi:hypothetical protein
MAKDKNGNGKHNEPAVINQTPSFLTDVTKEDAGKGTSTDREDNLVPLIYVLGAQSPQVNPRNPAYLEGASAGDIWLRNSGRPAIEGQKGLIFQPCYFYKNIVEWYPRESGLGIADQFDKMPPEAKEVPNPKNPKRTIMVMPNGNILTDTRYHVGYAILDDGATVMPYVIPLSSTGISVSRAWMFLQNSKKIGQTQAPSWSALYLLKTRERTNNLGTWFTFDVADAGWIKSPEDYARGKALYEAFATGTLQAQQAEPEPQEQEPEDEAF